MNQQSNRVTLANNKEAFTSLHSLRLGGINQKILIVGKNPKAPVVIVLHGGPGNCIPGCGCRKMFENMADRFTFVLWDQLGSGLNNQPIDNSYTIDRFVDMTSDLIVSIKDAFKGNKLFLFAASWGSVLSAKILERDGRCVDGVVASGQITSHTFFNKEVIGSLEKSAIKANQLERIRQADPESCTKEQVMLVSQSLMKYTDGYINKKGKSSIWPLLKTLFLSPDYRLKDCIAAVVNGTSKNDSLFEEIVRVNLEDTLSSVQIPYIMIQGDTDIITSTANTLDLVQKAQNLNLKVRVIEKCGHIASDKAMEAIFESLDELST